jgi:Kef-type K+ transport system membrane component KefB
LPLLIWGPLRLGRVFPLPIIQIFAGIFLGPAVLGALAPDVFTFLFRKDLLVGAETLANVALVLFVFLAGCELDRQLLQGAASTVLKIGTTGVFVPWLIGGGVAWLIVQYYAPAGMLGPNGTPLLFAVAFGLCMAVTALPVLAVILRELGFDKKPIGTIALAVGGVDDALLWSSLTVLLPFATGGSDTLRAFLVAIGGGIATILLLAWVVAPAIERLIAREAPERLLISLAMIVLFFFAAFNQATQLHAAIGAFLTGLLLPDKVRHLAQNRLDAPVTLLLLPFLFLAAGLKTSFSFTDGTIWLLVIAAMIVCVGTKFLGVTLPAYASGESMPFSATLGVLMQCKGLMEIVIVTILYQKGVFGQTTFSALILVALISTAITVPMARLCQRTWGEAATRAREPDAKAVAPAPVPAPVPEPVPAAAPPAAAAPARAPRLVLADGRELALPKPEVVIGRHSSDDVRINDVRISRHHARLVTGAGRNEIHNQTAVRSEPNPMLVNGVEKEHAELKDGDVISLGGVSLTFRAA